MSDEKTTQEKNFQNEMKDSVHKVWLAGLGALATAEEEGSKLFKNLVERGEGFEAKNKERVSSVTDELKSKVDDATQKARGQAEGSWERVEGKIEQAVASAFQKAGVPSRDEIATLTKRVDELISVVEKLQGSKAAS